MHSRLALLLLTVTLSLPAFGIYKKGDVVSNLCWKNHEDKTVCLDDNKGNVHVLLYNAGWCGPCNQEFTELVPQVGPYMKKGVQFISISGNGWSQNSRPDVTFLKSWRTTYKIPFPVTGAYRDFGADFFTPPLGIPAVVILDAKGKLYSAEVNPGADWIINTVKAMVP